VSNLYQSVSCETVHDGQKNKEVTGKMSHGVYHETVSRDSKQAESIDFGPRLRDGLCGSPIGISLLILMR